MYFERIPVNVSGGQLRTNFVDTVREVPQETGSAAENLELELAETHLMTGLFEPINIPRELSDMGISITIDDLGLVIHPCRD